MPEEPNKTPKPMKPPEKIRDGDGKPPREYEHRDWPRSHNELQKMAVALEEDHIERILTSIDMLVQNATDERDLQLVKNLREAKTTDDLRVVLPPFFAKLEREHDFLKYDQPGYDGNWLSQYSHSFLDMNKAFQRGCNNEAAMLVTILQHLQELGSIRKDFDFRAEAADYWENKTDLSMVLCHTAVMVYDKRSDTRYPQLVIDPWIAPPTQPLGMFHGQMEPPARFMGDIRELQQLGGYWEAYSAKTENDLNSLLEKSKEEPAFRPLFYWILGVLEHDRQEAQGQRDFLSSYSLGDKWEAADTFLKKWSKEHRMDDNLLGNADLHDYLFMKYFADPHAELRFAISKPYFESMKAKLAYFLSEERGGGELGAEEISSLLQCKTMDELQKYASAYFRKFYGNSKLVQGTFEETSPHSVR